MNVFQVANTSNNNMSIVEYVNMFSTIMDKFGCREELHFHLEVMSIEFVEINMCRE